MAPLSYRATIRLVAMTKYLLVLAILACTTVLVSATGSYRSNNGRYRRPHPRRWPRKTFMCNRDEVWSTCAAAVCRPKTCDEVRSPVPCIDLAPDGKCPSGPGCICRENFAKDNRGVCVPIEFCPPRITCNKNEELDLCPSSCPFRTCGINDAAVSCAASLPVGHPKCPPPVCRCKDGFYRNHRGHCVLWKKCPKCKGSNEMYDPCPSQCPPRRCDVNPALILCEVQPSLGDPRCKPSCRCVDGFVRNYTGICIPEDKCPKCPEPNQIFDFCLSCPPKRCDVDERVIRCAAPLEIGDPRCESGCRCIDGYKMNSEGVCIPEEQCPPKCSFNEIFSDCIPNDCKPENCSQVGTEFECPILPAVCRQGCICKEGHVRDKYGECIPIEKCPPKCSINEVFSDCIPNDCKPENCSQVGTEFECPILPAVCRQGCICKEGHVRNEYGECIPIEKCPPKCSFNEVYCDCIPNDCKPEHCSQVGTEFECPIRPAVCRQGCICKKGHVRNKHGVCIPIEKCPPKCPINEKFSNCIQNECDPQNCTQLGFPIQCNEVEAAYCKQGCICVNGFVRDARGKCIPAGDCPTCRGDCNQVSGCGVYCNQRCRDVGNKEPNFCIQVCYENACNCREGYFLDENTGFCVRPEQCSTPQCPVNEILSDCIQGNCKPENCTQVGFPVACPRIDPKYCKKGCICREGYARNEYGYCVPVGECPPQCPVNEVLSQCINGGCQARNCSQYGKPVPCVKLDPKYCISGCVCKENYLRASNGKCVPEKNCPVPKCPVNERYEECPGSNCEPEYCYQLGFPLPCPDQTDNVSCSKKPGCVCIDGYVRDKNGRCIPKNECRSCGGDIFARFGCGVNCGKKCRDLGNGTRPCIKICYNNACDCLDGYYYDAKQKKCVLPGQCTDICGKNEMFEDCTNPTCKAETCSELGFPLDCKKTCKKGCKCQNGFVRDKNGVCIPADQCPSCGGDKNARLGCGTNCNQRCPNNYINPKFCPRIACVPQLNKCDCRPGYYFDVNTKKCVKFEDCSPRCNEQNNEIPDSCVNGGCGWRNCSQLSEYMLCIDPIKCIPGCTCKEGYYRLDDGTCVPKDQCPKISCGGDENAKPGCGYNCGKRCPNNYINPKLCPRIQCKPDKCDCKDGFFYDINTKRCVRLEDCSPRCNDKNCEVYDSCVNGGCGWKNCTQVGRPVVCTRPLKCYQGCKCKEGFYRLNDGTCVPESQCPKKCNGPNEHFACGVACDNVCGKEENQKNCPIQNKKCIPKCYCNEGFARNEHGVCIPQDECPRKCKGPNEHFACGVACDNVCGEKENQTNCLIKNIKCNPKCYCNEGFARNKHGICIPQNQCPQICDGPYEYFDCGPECDNVCGKRENKYNCPRVNIRCNPKCYCYDGFARNEHGICIPQHLCPRKCKGPNEYFACGPPCDNVCGKKENKYNCPILNKADLYKKCYNKCYCYDGFARNQFGICVPINQCPRRTTYDGQSNAPVNIDNALAKFERGNQALAGQFLYHLLQSRPGENFMISGFSVLVALAQLALYAIGATLEQLMRILYVDRKEEIRAIFPVLIKYYKAQKQVQFELAIKYFSDQKYPFSSEFTEDSREVFNSTVQSLDFSRNVQAAFTINDWVEHNTNGLIKDLVSADMFNEDTRAVLVNTLYFYGNWQKQFDKANTQSRDFYVDEETTVSVDTMFQQGKFAYAENDDLDCQVLVLPYEGGNFTFTILLPRKKFGLHQMVEKLREPDYLYNALNSLTTNTVRVYLPTMNSDANISDLPELLKKVNLTALFDPSSNGFQGITESGEPLFISDIVQKTKIIVDEKGTEAAAATATVMATTAFILDPSEVYTVDCNQPFVYVLQLGKFSMFYGVYSGRT